jgi:Uma2 family endonuclease
MSTLGLAPHTINKTDPLQEITAVIARYRSSNATLDFPILLDGIAWETYRALMTTSGEGRGWRIAYEQGLLEIRMPLTEHEEPKEILGDLITVLVDELLPSRCKIT